MSARARTIAPHSPLNPEAEGEEKGVDEYQEQLINCDLASMELDDAVEMLLEVLGDNRRDIQDLKFVEDCLRTMAKCIMLAATAIQLNSPEAPSSPRSQPSSTEDDDDDSSYSESSGSDDGPSS